VPHYYFHIDELGTDPEGTELPDLKAARHEAVLLPANYSPAMFSRGGMLSR
jgi:hypothetical protein